MDTALAAQIRWTNQLGGSWMVADNWEGRMVPGPFDIAIIDLGTIGPVFLDQDTKVLAIKLGHAAGIQQVLTIGSRDASGIRLTLNAKAADTQSEIFPKAVLEQYGHLEGAGTAVLSIQPLGTVRLVGQGDHGINGLKIDNQGSIEIQEGQLGINGDSISKSGSFLLQSGTFLVLSGGTHTVDPASDVQGLGTVMIDQATVNFAAPRLSGKLINNGVFRPGSSPGAVTIDGDYEQKAGGTLEIELAGTTAGAEHDQLLISGLAKLTGTLTVNRGAYTPKDGDQFQILRFADKSGDFSSKNGLELINNIRLVEKDPTSRTDVILMAQAAQADLRLTKTDLKDPASVGEKIEYRLSVTNAGPDPANNVVITDTLPPGTSFASASAGCSQPVIGTVVCNIPSIAVGASVTVDILVSPSSVGTYTNTAQVRANESDPKTIDNSDSEDTTVNPSADLSITKTDSPDPLEVGDNLTYTISVSNAGPSAANTVMVSDTLPAGVTLVSSSASQGSCTGTTTVTCNLGAISSRGTASVTLVVRPNSSGSITNTASVSATEGDPDPANNSDSTTTLVKAAGVDLTINKTGSPSSVEVDQQITYTITVTNAGLSPASGVTVTDPLPAGTTLVSASATQGSCTGSSLITCSLGSIASGASVTITIIVKATAAGTLVNRASVTASEADTNPQNNSSTATTTVNEKSGADVKVAKTASPSRINSGQSVVYEIIVTNDGPNTATSVTMKDTLPSGAVRQSVTTDRGSCTGTAVIDCQLGSMSRDARATITIRALLNGNGVLRNEARVQASESDPDTDNNVAFADVQIGNVDLSVLKTARPATVAPGDAIDYTIVVTNRSNGFVGGITVRDEFPGEVLARWECATSAGGRCASPSGIGDIFTTVDLPANGTATFTARALVSLSARLKLTNMATVAPPVGIQDSNLSNNSSSVETAIFIDPCPRDYRPEIRAFAESHEKEVILKARGLADLRSDHRFELSTHPRDFSAAQTMIVPAGAGVMEDGELIYTAVFQKIVAQPQKFYGRVIALGCHPENPSLIADTTLFPTPNATDDDLRFRLPKGSSRPSHGQLNLTSALLGGSSSAKEILQSANVSITTDKTHLTVSPSTTTIPPSGTATVTVTVNPTGLPTGTTTGTVVVTNTTTGASTSIPMSVTLTTPLTPGAKGPAPPNALIVPVVAFAQGVSSRWISDLRITNTAPVPIRYQLTLTPSEQDGTEHGKQTTLSVDPGQTLGFDNVAEQQFGIGSLGESGSGVLEIRPLDFAGKAVGPHQTNKALLATVVASRTYNQAAAGTVSQFIPGIPFARAVRRPEPNRRSVLSLQHITQSDETRTNVGFVEGSGQPATLLLRVFDVAGQKVDEFSIDLQAAEHKQLNSVLASRGISLPEGRIEMEVTSSTGQIIGYASVIHSGSSDSIFVPGVDLSEATASKFIVPAVTESFEASSTDLRVFNASAESVQATLAFYRQNESNAAKTAEVTIGPGEVKVLDSVLSATFGETQADGTIQITTTQAVPLVVSARSRLTTSSGSTSQFVEARTINDSAGSLDRALQIIQLEESDRFQSDIGIAEVTGNPVTVEISGTTADSKIETKQTIQLQANELRQIGAILKELGAGRVYNGRVAVKVIAGTGRVLAYGSLRDLATGDITLIPAQ